MWLLMYYSKEIHALDSVKKNAVKFSDKCMELKTILQSEVIMGCNSDPEEQPCSHSYVDLGTKFLPVCVYFRASI